MQAGITASLLMRGSADGGERLDALYVYIEYSAPLVRDLERSYLESEAFTSIRRIWTILRSVKN